ncbi:MAG: glycosyltransferase family 4 protein [Bacteroidota bacterium]
MKIVMLNDALVRGGKERRLIELLKGLKQYPEVSVELIIFSKDIDYPEIHDICPQLHILERNPKKDPRVFSRLYRLIKQIKPDVMHSWGSMPSVYALPVVIGQGIPLVNAMITNAQPDMPWHHVDYRRGRMTFPLSKLVIGNSKAGLEAYDAPKDRAACVYNGFDFRRIESLMEETDIRAQYQIKTPKVVAMLGAFASRKDYPTYIKAAISILEKRNDVSFLAIGGGKLLPECKALVPAAFQDRILFPGMVKNVESLVNILDVGVLASNSKVHGEGISNAILEFMALGKPVVATRGGGTPEIVQDGETGFMVPAFDVDAMANKIDYLLTKPEEAEAMGQKGEARVRAAFNLENMAQRYYDIYHSILGKKAPQKASIL